MKSNDRCPRCKDHGGGTGAASNAQMRVGSGVGGSESQGRSNAEAT